MNDDEPELVVPLHPFRTFPEEVEDFMRQIQANMLRHMLEPWAFNDDPFGRYRLDWWPWMTTVPARIRNVPRAPAFLRARLAETWDVLLHGVPEHECW